MKESIEAMLWDFIIDNNIATEDEVRLVTNINDWNEETMTDIIYAKTGLRSYEQCKDEGYSGTDELDSYYCLEGAPMSERAFYCLTKINYLNYGE